MRCPYCGKMEDKVLESRTMSNGESIRRRRECTSCGYRFTSYEKIEYKPLMVLKKNGRRQPFDRTKIEKGIERIGRPMSDVQTAIENVANLEVGELVLEKLNEIDKVAYIRFASVYKHFENLDEFITEVKKIDKKRG